MIYHSPVFSHFGLVNTSPILCSERLLIQHGLLNNTTQNDVFVPAPLLGHSSPGRSDSALCAGVAGGVFRPVEEKQDVKFRMSCEAKELESFADIQQALNVTLKVFNNWADLVNQDNWQGVVESYNEGNIPQFIVAAGLLLEKYRLMPEHYLSLAGHCLNLSSICIRINKLNESVSLYELAMEAYDLSERYCNIHQAQFNSIGGLFLDAGEVWHAERLCHYSCEQVEGVVDLSPEKKDGDLTVEDYLDEAQSWLKSWCRYLQESDQDIRSSVIAGCIQNITQLLIDLNEAAPERVTPEAEILFYLNAALRACFENDDVIKGDNLFLQAQVQMIIEDYDEAQRLVDQALRLSTGNKEHAYLVGLIRAQINMARAEDLPEEDAVALLLMAHRYLDDAEKALGDFKNMTDRAAQGYRDTLSAHRDKLPTCDALYAKSAETLIGQALLGCVPEG